MRTTPSLYPLNRSNFALKEILRGVDIRSEERRVGKECRL